MSSVENRSDDDLAGCAGIVNAVMYACCFFAGAMLAGLAAVVLS